MRRVILSVMLAAAFASVVIAVGLRRPDASPIQAPPGWEWYTPSGATFQFLTRGEPTRKDMPITRPDGTMAAAEWSFADGEIQYAALVVPLTTFRRLKSDAGLLDDAIAGALKQTAATKANEAEIRVDGRLGREAVFDLPEAKGGSRQRFRVVIDEDRLIVLHASGPRALLDEPAPARFLESLAFFHPVRRPGQPKPDAAKGNP